MLYSATFSAIAVSAAQDVFEIAAPATSRVKIIDCFFGQYSDFGDTAAEILSVLVIRGYTTTGTGGATVTPAPLAVTGTRTAVSTVKRNNTTVAQDGTAETLLAGTVNIAAGWSLRDVLSLGDPRWEKQGYGLWLTTSQRLVVRITAPADALTMNGTLIFEETGSTPA